MDEKTKQAAEEKVRLKRLHVLKQSLNILSCNMFWFEYLCVAGGGYDSTDRLSPIYHESNIIRAVFFWGKWLQALYIFYSCTPFLYLVITGPYECFWIFFSVVGS